MKKIVAIAIIPLFLLSACGSAIPPLSLDVELTPKAIEQDGKPLELRDIVAGGPLFVPGVDSANPTLAAYRKLRKARADELVAMTGEARDELVEALEAMPELRSLLLTYLANLAEALGKGKPDEAQLATIALDTVNRAIEGAARTTAAYAALESTGRTLEEAKIPDDLWYDPITPMFQYLEYSLVLKLAETIRNEITFLPARAAGILLVAQANEKTLGKKVKKLTKKFDRKFGKRLAKVNELYSEALETRLDLAAGFDSLAAADYAFTMATLEFTKSALPEAFAKARGITPGEMVTAEDKAFAETTASFLTVFTDDMRRGIEEKAPPPFLEHLDAFASSGNLIPPFEGVAHAGVTDWLEKASTSLTAGLAGAGEKLYGGMQAAGNCVTSPWQCTKATVSAAGSAAYSAGASAFKAADAVTEATGVQSAFKFGQTMVGVAVDCVALPAIIGSAKVSQWVKGTSDRDAAVAAADQISTMFKAWDEGKPGSIILGGGVKALTSAEEGIGKATETVASAVLGVPVAAAGYVADKVTPQIVKDAAGTLAEGVDWLGKKTTGLSIKETFTTANAGYAAGKVAEITANMATGFVKGVMQIGNVASTPTDLAEGLLNTASGITGGIKALVKTAQVSAGARKLGQEVSKKLPSVVKRLEIALENKALGGKIDDIMKTAEESLDGKKIADLCRKQSEVMENMMKEQYIQRQEKQIGQILSELKEKTGKTVLGNLNEMPGTMKKLVTTQYDNSLSGMKEVAKEIFGKDVADYADNFINGLGEKVATGYLRENEKALVPPEQQQAIAKVESAASSVAAMGLDLNDALVQQAMAQIEEIRAQTSAALASVKEQAEAYSAAMAKEMVKQELATKALKEADKRLTTPVSARGSFEGGYGGSVRLSLVPGGGPVSGTVTTKYGSASISGSVTEKGNLSARVSGRMTYDYYPDGVHLEKRSCQLSGSMSGSVSARNASGSYSGSCADEKDSGSWSVNW